jgi:hypothetical protein
MGGRPLPKVSRTRFLTCVTNELLSLQDLKREPFPAVGYFDGRQNRGGEGPRLQRIKRNRLKNRKNLTEFNKPWHLVRDQRGRRFKSSLPDQFSSIPPLN